MSIAIVSREVGTRDAEVGARFDGCAARFKAEVARDDARLAALVRTVGLPVGLRILDLGCGKGRFAARLGELGATVVGIDLSAAMLAKARGIDRARASARRLPFADASFDAVVAVEVLEHVGAIGPVVAEARRVLRPGGCLAVVDKNALALDARRPWLPAVAIKWLDQHRGVWMYPPGSSVQERWFVPRSLAGQIRRRGFESVRVEYLLTPRESRRCVHRAIPVARLMTLWAARVPAGGAA